METIKQAPGSKDCLACVAAMATDTTVELYKEYCWKNRLDPEQDYTFIQYLWFRGYLAGFYFEGDGVHGRIEFSQLDCVTLLSSPAFIAVESRSEKTRKAGNSHAVYWDGKKLHDPNGDYPKESYKIISVLPIIRTRI